MCIIKKTVILIFVSLLFSCKNHYIAKYKLNRTFEFKTRQQYYSSVTNEMDFPDSLLLYIDSAGYNGLIPIISDKEVSVYFGSFINDSVSIKKSDFLKDNQSCIGRMETEIHEHISKKEFPPGTLDSSINLTNIDFFSLKENRLTPIFQENNKVKIILFYTYSFGTYYKKLFHEIIDVYEKNREKTDLYIISLDGLAYLKDK